MKKYDFDVDPDNITHVEINLKFWYSNSFDKVYYEHKW